MKPKTQPVPLVTVTEVCRVSTYYVAACEVNGETLFCHMDDHTGGYDWVPDPEVAWEGIKNKAYVPPSDARRVFDTAVRKKYPKPKGFRNLRMMRISRTLNFVVGDV